jgi:hypothetical protein
VGRKPSYVRLSLSFPAGYVAEVSRSTGDLLLCMTLFFGTDGRVC